MNLMNYSHSIHLYFHYIGINYVDIRVDHESRAVYYHDDCSKWFLYCCEFFAFISQQEWIERLTFDIRNI